MSGNGPRRSGNEARWQEILDAAAEVFFEKGYDGTSIQAVADRVGLLKGSLYHYITTKDDLLFAIISDVHLKGLPVLERARASEGDTVTRLREFVEDYATFTIQERVKASVFDRDFRALNGDKRAQLVGERDVYDDFLRDLIAEGVADGTFAPDVDPVILRNVIFQMINSIYRWFSPTGSRSAEEIAAIVAQFAVAGLTGYGRS